MPIDLGLDELFLLSALCRQVLHAHLARHSAHLLVDANVGEAGEVCSGADGRDVDEPPVLVEAVVLLRGLGVGGGGGGKGGAEGAGGGDGGGCGAGLELGASPCAGEQRAVGSILSALDVIEPQGVAVDGAAREEAEGPAAAAGARGECV